MHRQFLMILLAAGFVPAAVSAQAPAAGKAPAARPSASPSLGAEAMRRNWDVVTGYIIRAAENMPETKYTFRPTPEVRSFGQLIGHVAGAQQMFCAIALGEPAAAENDIEKSVTAKADLVAAIRKTTEYCNRAYAQGDSALAGMTKIFGQDANRMYVLAMNTVHNGEHYGNLVTYLRINGMVPPSSQPSP